MAHVLTPTEHTRQDLIKHFAVNPDNVSVTPNGINHQIFKTGTVKTRDQLRRQLPHLADDFVLCVGRIEHPAKGHVDMLRAWHRLRSSGHDLPQLVFVGRNCERSSEVWQEADRLGAAVLHLDTVDDVTLARLYAHCRAFVFPSHYEGFGLPPVEAQASGAIIVSTQAGAWRETIGPAAITTPVADDHSLSQAVLQALRLSPTERQRRIALGQAWSQQFSWERTASATHAVYQRVYQRRYRRPVASQRRGKFSDKIGNEITV